MINNGSFALTKALSLAVARDRSTRRHMAMRSGSLIRKIVHVCYLKRIFYDRITRFTSGPQAIMFINIDNRDSAE